MKQTILIYRIIFNHMNWTRYTHLINRFNGLRSTHYTFIRESILNNIVTQRNFYPPLCKLKLISPLCWANSIRITLIQYTKCAFTAAPIGKKGWNSSVYVYGPKRRNWTTTETARLYISYLLDMQSALKLNYLLDGQPGRTRLSCPLPLAAHFYYHLCCVSNSTTWTSLFPVLPPFFERESGRSSYLLFADAFRHLLHKLFVAQPLIYSD